MPSLQDKTATTVSAGTISAKSIVIDHDSVFKRIFGKNTGVASFYLHFINSNILPPDGAPTLSAIKIAPILVGAGMEFTVDLAICPVIFDTGICIYASTTDFNKTLIVGNDLVATLQYADKQ